MESIFKRKRSTMNTLEKIAKLEAELAELKAKASAKPRCDAQGRLLEAPEYDATCYSSYDGGNYELEWEGCLNQKKSLEQGRIFISRAAAQAELTRLKCLQRLRGMEGFIPNGDWHVHIQGKCVFNGFITPTDRNVAEATITPEERAAFFYREPVGE
jgi:hypothetical protein